VGAAFGRRVVATSTRSSEPTRRSSGKVLAVRGRGRLGRSFADSRRDSAPRASPEHGPRSPGLLPSQPSAPERGVTLRSADAIEVSVPIVPPRADRLPIHRHFPLIGERSLHAIQA
jgi:hypothetical protein